MDSTYDSGVQATQLRPLGIGELVDGAVSLCRAHLKTLVVITAVVIVPAAALTATLQTWVFDGFGPGEIRARPDAVGLITLIGVAFALSAAIHATGQGFLGAQPHWYDSLGAVIADRRLRKTALIFGLALAIGTAFLFLPGLWVVAAWSLALPVAVFEGSQWRSAFERSRHLSFRDWQVPALLVAAFIATMIVGAMLEGIAALGGLVPSAAHGPAAFVRHFLAELLVPLGVVPVMGSVLTVAYVDRVLRDDELDLDLMGKHLDAEPNGDAGATVMDGVAAPLLRDPIEGLMRRGERDFRCWAGKTRDLVEQLRRPSDGGEPAMPIEPDRPLAIMFTDVDGSTPLTEELGDLKAREILRGHEELVRSSVGAWGGRTVRHTGDGVMACFPSASQALECALMIEREQEIRNRTTGAPITVRIGINAGEPVADDGDLFGVAVNVTQSLLDVAGPGEVMVSEVVRQLAAGKGFVFDERGERVLDGLSEPVRLYALCGR